MKKLLVIAAAASLVGAGCAASSTTSVDTNTNTAAPANPAPAQPSATGSAGVNSGIKVNVGGKSQPVQVRVFSTIHTTIQNFAFTNPTITVKKGDQVEFTNKDSAPHTVTADAGAFASGNIQAGQKFIVDTKTFETGIYKFHCALHPNMTGVLIVQ